MLSASNTLVSCMIYIHVGESARFNCSQLFQVFYIILGEWDSIVIVRQSFPMITITSSMMMMSCFVDPVGTEVANQSNSGVQHSSTLGACRAG